MADQHQSGRFPGEIAAPGDFSGPVLDAEFESVPADRQVADAVTRTRPSPPPATGMDMLRHAPADPAARRGGPVFWVVGALIVACAFWVSGGHALMRTAGADLVIRDLDIRIEDRNGRAFIMVDGRIANEGRAVRAVPPLAINVVGAGGQTIRYTLRTNGESVQAGGDFAFSSRLEATAGKIGSVNVEFVEK